MMKYRIFALALCLCLLAGCAAPAAPAVETTAEAPAAEAPAAEAPAPRWQELKQEGSLPLRYATEFSADYYSGGYTLISITDGCRYLLVPENTPVPTGLEDGITVLQQPIRKIYLASTSAMDLYRAIGGMDAIRLSSLQESGWYIPEAREATARGDILFAGKYSTPDYELICSEQCDLAVENTMIYHTPDVKEQLERVGIPVLVERSSFEKNPLGRMEWMKLHALLIGQLEQAEAVYDAEMAALEGVLGQQPTGKTVAFCSINSNGSVTVRRTGDYIVQTIEMAGGTYVFPDLGGDQGSSATVTIQMEIFFQTAKEADFLIINSIINGEMTSLDTLLNTSPLLSSFKAVQEGNVWMARQNLFQESMGLGHFILELNHAFTGTPGEGRFLQHLA